jgi:glycine cleavage system H protein
MNFPSDLKYSKTHEWVKVNGDTATIGITDYAQGELGDVVFVEVSEGIDAEKENPVGTIEAVKTVSDIYAPISGKVLESNPVIKETPETINKDPYGEGWILKMSIQNKGELNDLLDVEAYKKLIGQ